jgi:signal transduction histidine kinase
LQIEVIDTGIGISLENMKSLFKVFGKLKASSKMNENGIGLGLTICKRISEFLGGSISVNSKEGVGSTFKVLIKLNALENNLMTKSVTTFDDCNEIETD